MWSVITRIFTKTSNNSKDHSGNTIAVDLDRELITDNDMDDTFVTKQAKQRASVKWLLSKAFNNKVPENLKEPFYRDHENQEHLKPQIVGALANAELYCFALGNIYSDPSYHSLNHSNILQTLARKGVLSDVPLTETTLIQTNPLRMSAHMAVIESIMILYSKEVVTSDRVLAAVQRFSYGRSPTPQMPEDHEHGIFLWISHACAALKKRIEQDLDTTTTTNGDGDDRLKVPEFPIINELKDLSDGLGLGALISYYCSDELPWQNLRITNVPSVQDSLYNLCLVQHFCLNCLPASIFHLTPEDITYMRDSMKQNLIVFLADLFNIIEIHPAKCVRYPGMDKFSNEGFPPRNEHGVVHKRNLLQTVMTPIPDLRSGLDDPTNPTAFQVTRSTPTHVPLRKTNSLQQSIATSEMSEDSLRRGSDDSSFIVHRGKNIPTLNSIIVQQQQQQYNDEPIQATTRSKLSTSNSNSNNSINNRQQMNDLNNEMIGAAGKPSNWEENRKSSFAGRRSRRNSMTDDSQLTIENFGGSQDNLNFIGRNIDKEVGVHTVGRKISAPNFPIIDNNPAIRSSLQDAKGSIQLGYSNGCEKIDDNTEKFHNNNKLLIKRQLSNDDISLRNILHLNKQQQEEDYVDGDLIMNKMSSFADLNKQKILNDSTNIQQIYMQNEQQPTKSSFLNKNNTSSTSNTNGSTNNNEKKTTSFATLPNTTTWQQQQQISNQQHHHHHQHDDDSNCSNNDSTTINLTNINSAQLNDVRLKLEEKRRLIESEKRRAEMVVNKQRQKVGKAAFLQAVAKGRGNLLKTSNDAESNSNSATGSESQSPSSESAPSKPQKPFTLQDINDETTNERTWSEESQNVNRNKTPDVENVDFGQYQQSIAQMNSSLSDIQNDIQRLASQQSQIQAAQQQSLIAQQQKQIQALQQQQQYQALQQQQQQQQQTLYSPQIYSQPQQSVYSQPLQTSASAPHIPQSLYQQPQFFLHEQPPSQSPSPSPNYPAVTTTTQRRTWAQQPTPPPPPPLSIATPPPPPPTDLYQSELRTWGQNSPQTAGSSSSGGGGGGGGFVLYMSDRGDNSRGGGYQQSSEQSSPRFIENSRYQNGGDHNLHHSNSFTLSQQHLQQHQQQHQQQQYGGTSHSTPSASPQHRHIHRQISQLMDENKRTITSPVSLQQIEQPSTLLRKSNSSVIHAPIPTPSVDDMEPQNISFIGNSTIIDPLLSEGLSRLNITSGSRTYRIPSPTRPLISRNAFHPSSSTSPPPLLEQPTTTAEISSLDNDPTNKKGFYISFDDEQPKRPKPPLRTKRNSPKKERNYDEENERFEKRKLLEIELEQERLKKLADDERKRILLIQQERDKLRTATTNSMKHNDANSSQDNRKITAASAIIIGNELSNPDPDLVDERERKKEKIMLLSLQRRQEQEEAKARKEQEAQARREKEKAKEDEKLRKKEEQAARRAAILEQYKLKKAMEEADREGKVFDKSELMGSLKPTPKMRPKAATRPRPKTIHIDSGSVEMAEGMLQPSRGKKGSNTNLTANSYTPSTMKRDYYRGSQDSLADRSMSSGLLYRDSPDDSRGMSPCHANQTLGRRSSYKTSRDPSPAQVRGRPKYSNYQNFKGRKSSSLMNLYGSSTDQDSLAYRYGDTDSGLGRATPPRRAPSPGMGSMRHLPSPSGPGSLPGFMTKGRRVFDDGSSDISSTPSSMLDYTGPRLYKQPATKSNRGIMLNAVEYCVFPGAVNREAKKRVLEEINRSESKHFLILFRDTGCQFRALYSYCPDGEEIIKLYGTGPKQVNDRMFDKFFKYNSGGKCFSQVHTKHLTVTIDAFTIHNSLWQGKKVNLPNKKEMALVI